MLSLIASLTPVFVSLQRCFTLMDRGFTFKLISNYINMITAADSKVTKKNLNETDTRKVEMNHTDVPSFMCSYTIC